MAPPPFLPLLAALALAQAGLFLLARGLGLRLPWRVMGMGVALAVLVVSPWLLSDRIMVPNDEAILNNVPGTVPVADLDRHGLFNDIPLQLLPWEFEVRRAYGEWRLPLWSDLLDGGSSPWVNPQAAVLSPIAMLARLFPIEHSLLGALAVKVLLAFEGVWLLARRLGARRIAAALAGAGFALSGAIMAWALFPMSSAAAWAPWLAVAVVILFRRPTGRRVAVTGVIFAGVLLAGHPETELAAGLFAAFCGLCFRRRTRPFLPRLGAAAGAMALGLALAAPHVLPFLKVLPETQRAVRSAERAMAPDEAPEWRPTLLLAPTNPWVYGRPFREPYRGPITWAASGGGYAGMLALAGAALALFARRRWRIVLPLLAFAGVAWLLAAGFRPLVAPLESVPLLQAVAFNRFLPIASLALGLAGALGVSEALRRRADPWIWLGLALVAGGSLAIRAEPVVAFWALAVSGFLIGRRSRIPGAALLGLALFAEQLPWAWDMLPRGNYSLFYPWPPVVEAAAKEAGKGGPWRITGGGFIFYPSLGPVYGMAEVRAHNPMALKEPLDVLETVFAFKPEGRRYKSAFRRLDHPLLDFLNVRVVMTGEKAPVPNTLERIDNGRLGPARLYRNPDALPRLFLAPQVRVRERAGILEALTTLRNPRRVFLASEEVGDWQPPRRPWNPAAVRVFRWTPGDIVMGVPREGEKLLASSLPFPSGWTAHAGGTTLRTVHVNYAYLGVIVPDGVETVRLTFAPPGLRAGLWIFALGLIGTAALLVWGRGRR
ncbi:MAG TPA: YfhO family protein [Thermoanaerobaculia bacterium]|nr:YfhO family protein [Thermoanaerobaculia bacterium]